MSVELICSSCGTQAKPRTDVQGSILIELILWLLFLIPGLLYSVWRLSTKRKVCRECGAATLVPVTSPIGIQIAATYSKEASS